MAHTLGVGPVENYFGSVALNGTTAGRGIIVLVRWNDDGTNTITSITCTGESNLTLIGSVFRSSNVDTNYAMQMAYLSNNVNGGDKTIAVNFSAAQGVAGVCAVEFAGGDTSGWLGTTPTPATGNSDPATMGITTTTANELIIGQMASMQSPTAGSGYTQISMFNLNREEEGQYKLDAGAAGAKTFDFSLAAAGQFMLHCASFKAAAADPTDSGTQAITADGAGSDAIADAGTQAIVVVSPAGSEVSIDQGGQSVVLSESGADAIGDAGSQAAVLESAGSEALADAGTQIAIVTPQGSEIFIDEGGETIPVTGSGSDAIADAGSQTAVVLADGDGEIDENPPEPIVDSGGQTIIADGSGLDTFADTGAQTVVVTESGEDEIFEPEPIEDDGEQVLIVLASGSHRVVDLEEEPQPRPRRRRVITLNPAPPLEDIVDSGVCIITVIATGSGRVVGRSAALQRQLEEDELLLQLL